MATNEHERNRKTMGRRLWGMASFRQDWDQEAIHGDVGYWELFTDLLMVAAASAIAENLEDNPSHDGFVEFALLYTAMVHGWLLYTLQYTSRFLETSLAHYFVLFFFSFGVAISIANAGYDTARYFSLGVLIHRLSCIFMFLPIGYAKVRARRFVVMISTWTLLTCICHFVVFLKPEWAIVGWSASGLLDFGFEAVSSRVLSGQALIPINIEHSQDRLGVLNLVMLGETVISATITFREYAAESNEHGSDYYLVLALSFLLIFMFLLLFFNVQPVEEYHAFRRSRFWAVLYYMLNKILGLVLLLVGVCIKLIVKAVGEEEHEAPFTDRWLGLSIGFSLMLLLAMRCCHYGGRIPRPTEPPSVKRLMWIWWFLFAAASLVPFCFIGLDSHVQALAVHSGFLLLLCIVETWFTEVLEDHLPSGGEEAEPLVKAASTGEGPRAYDSTSEEKRIERARERENEVQQTNIEDDSRGPLSSLTDSFKS